MMDTVFSKISALLQSCDADASFMPPTQLYNEGWMLKLIMDWFASIDVGNDPHQLAVPSGCRWYSEALLPSAFLPQSRGDARAESWTHADGVIGHFEIGNGAKANLTLLKDARHFVVLEAKMYSKLSAGIKNANYFNQAARNVACMAEVMKRARRPATEFSALGFYVLAPKTQIQQGIFNEHMSKDSIRNVVEKRVSEYGREREQWFTENFLPVLARLDIKTISWEELITYLVNRDPDARQLGAFYTRCIDFNKPLATGVA